MYTLKIILKLYCQWLIINNAQILMEPHIILTQFLHINALELQRNNDLGRNEYWRCKTNHLTLDQILKMDFLIQMRYSMLLYINKSCKEVGRNDKGSKNVSLCYVSDLYFFGKIYFYVVEIQIIYNQFRERIEYNSTLPPDCDKKLYDYFIEIQMFHSYRNNSCANPQENCVRWIEDGIIYYNYVFNNSINEFEDDKNFSKIRTLLPIEFLAEKSVIVNLLNMNFITYCIEESYNFEDLKKIEWKSKYFLGTSKNFRVFWLLSSVDKIVGLIVVLKNKSDAEQI